MLAINGKRFKLEEPCFHLAFLMSTVYFSENGNREQFVDKMLDIFATQLHKAKKVFVKPNIVSYEPYPTTTHPAVLEAILKQLEGKEVVVGDAPAIDAGKSNKILQKSLLNEVCIRYGVKLVNLYSEKMKKVQSPRGYKVKVSALPLACDFVISIPVLKVHGVVGLSGALKNQFGYLSKQDRFLMHCKIKDINKGIAEVNAAVHTDLFIVDAVETMIVAQECRHGGCPGKLNTMIAGTDPVSLDLFGLQLLKSLEPEFEHKNGQASKYIEYASSYGLGAKDYNVKEV
jgi:uncharacterized protein (DUF362 family)